MGGRGGAAGLTAGVNPNLSFWYLALWLVYLAAMRDSRLLIHASTHPHQPSSAKLPLPPPPPGSRVTAVAAFVTRPDQSIRERTVAVFEVKSHWLFVFCASRSCYDWGQKRRTERQREREKERKMKEMKRKKEKKGARNTGNQLCGNQGRGEARRGGRS